MNSGQALLTFSWLPKQTHPKTHKSSRGIKCPAASFKKTNLLEWASLFNQRLTAATVMTICVALSRWLYCDWLFLHQLRPPRGVSWRWLTQYCLELTKVTKIKAFCNSELTWADLKHRTLILSTVVFLLVLCQQNKDRFWSSFYLLNYISGLLPIHTL